MLLQDLFPLLAVGVGGIFLAIASPGRRRAAAPALFAGLALASTLALTVVEIDSSHTESHRFITAASLAAPLLGALWLTEVRALRRPGEILGSLAVAAGIALPAACSLAWPRSADPRKCERPEAFFSSDDFLDTDCRQATGAWTGRPAPAVLEQGVFYLYAGCQPVFVAGQKSSAHWQLNVGWPRFGAAALREVHERMPAPGAPLDVVCARERTRPDEVCDAAARAGGCRPIGEALAICALRAPARARLLGPRGP